MVEKLGGSRTQGDREGSVARTVAMAGRDAFVPPVRKGFVGDPHKPGNETNRGVLICLCRGQLVALHGFIKMTRATPTGDMALARKRQKELEG
jgi:hypothetical protein